MAMTNDVQLALQLHQAGKLAEAETAYRTILETQPNNAHALHFLGVIALQQNDPIQAGELIAKAVALLPDEPVFLCNLGQALTQQGRGDEALDAYNRSVEIAPKLTQAWHNLGLLHESRQDDRQALACHLRAKKTSQGPYMGDAVMHQLLLRNGLRSLEQGMITNATEYFDLATKTLPGNAASWSGLASSQTLNGRPLQAMSAFDRAIALAPKDANLYNNRANAFRDAGLFESAKADYQRAISLAPDSLDNLSNYLFASLADCQLDAQTLARLHLETAAPFAKTRATAGNSETDLRRGSGALPLRLGIVSADLRQHPVAWFMLAWFENRSSDLFHLTIYATGCRNDETTDRIRKTSDAWVECAELNDNELAERIRSDRIDLLLDLAGHTADNRLGVFACRPAARQATFLGYAGTTGLNCFDARIADRITEPEEETSHSSEPVVYLPGSYLCYQAPDVAPPVTSAPCLKQGYITFGSSAQLAKVTDSTLLLWGKVLAAIPNSRLFLRSTTLGDPLVRKRLMARATKAGIDTRRLRTDGPRPLAAHLGSWNQIDITLDTIPFNLATQSCESLWMGVPFISMKGNRHAGRLGTSILEAAGLDHLSATNEADFVQKCADLASAKADLERLRQGLRATLRAPGGLMDGPGFAGRLDALLLQIAQT